MGGPRISTLLLVALLLGACSGSASSSAESGSSEVVSSSSDVAVSSTVALEARPVPTVPPSTLPGQTGTTAPGVINASPTIVPEPPPPDNPDAPATTQAPPTTQLVGDPQPSPGTTKPPPPPTVAPPPAACDRLAVFDVAKIVSDATGATAVAETLSDSACRYAAGPVVVEVYFIAQATIRNEWYTRQGVEPVGEVSGDAVGLRSFLPVSGSSGAGYTIASVGGQQGVVVAVRGTDDGRYVAGQVAVFANQAA